MTVLTEAALEVRTADPHDAESAFWRSDVLLLDPPTLRRFIATRDGDLPPVLLLVANDDDDAWRLLGSCQGSVDRHGDVVTLIDAVRAVASGRRYAGAVGTSQTGGQPDNAPLSPREEQVLEQIAHGRTHGQIARSLGISRHTVDTYVKRIRSKQGLGNKAELTRAAVLRELSVG